MLAGTFAHSPHPEPTDTIPLGKPAMLGRRHSSSFSSIDAQYRSLPQSPEASQYIGIPSAIEEGEMAIEDIDDDHHMPSGAPVDSRILWVHSMLGSAGLLPWNGTSEAIPWLVV